jgi:hypothetical protein
MFHHLGTIKKKYMENVCFRKTGDTISCLAAQKLWQF